MNTLQILDLFDPGIMHLVKDINIDRPYNAITLSGNYHFFFRRLFVYFEADTSAQHTYAIKPIKPYLLPELPITRQLFITPDHNIDPPLPRLLAIHRACCLVMHLSGAGDYIEKVVQDMEEGTLRSDGTTEVSSILSLRLQKLVV